MKIVKEVTLKKAGWQNPAKKKKKNGIEGIIKQNDMINHNHKQITIQCYQIT